MTPPMSSAGPSQTAEEVADCIADVIANPVAEVFTNPAQVPVARAYAEDVGAFEARMASSRKTGAGGVLRRHG